MNRRLQLIAVCIPLLSILTPVRLSADDLWGIRLVSRQASGQVPPSADSPLRQPLQNPQLPQAPDVTPESVPPNVPPLPPPSAASEASASGDNSASIQDSSDDPFSFFRLPTVMGEFNGNATQLLHIHTVVPHSSYVVGQIVSGSPGSPTAVVAFDAGSFTTLGLGADVSGDGNADTFAITEPLPPATVPTSPGPTFTFQGGDVVYTKDTNASTAQDGLFMDGENWLVTYSFAEDITMIVPQAAVRRIKIAENNSPLPRDRLYFDYRFFNNVSGGIGDEQRYTIGFEKTFMDQLMSIDVRLPFAATLDSTQVVNSDSVHDFEFGNMTVIYKAMLTINQSFMTAAGCAFALPTGSSARVERPDGSQLLVIENQAVHALPFVGGIWLPRYDRLFVQGFLQLDVDLNGKTVRSDLAGSGPAKIGVLNDATLFFADLSMGYWLYPQRREHVVLKQAAWITELHYSTTVQDADAVRLPSPSILTVTDLSNRFDVLNATFGLFMDVGGGRALTAGMSVPMRSGLDHQFDVEASVLANWFF